MPLKGGIGWGYMPEPMVREDVEGGRLVPLDMPEVKRGSLRPYGIYRTGMPPGPAGSWLISRFEAQALGERRSRIPAQAPTARPRTLDDRIPGSRLSHGAA
jgi:DNA-binding transcriptional LysR family regulator